jgi:hypothetical protein
MKLPWSKATKVDKASTGNDVIEETAVEKKLGLSSIGTYVPLLTYLIELIYRIFASGASLFSDGYVSWLICG